MTDFEFLPATADVFLNVAAEIGVACAGGDVDGMIVGERIFGVVEVEDAAASCGGVRLRDVCGVEAAAKATGVAVPAATTAAGSNSNAKWWHRPVQGKKGESVARAHETPAECTLSKPDPKNDSNDTMELG